MKRTLCLIAGAILMAAVQPVDAGACSRVLYKGNDSLRIVGRSLDWKTPIPTNLYVYPKGIKKIGNTTPGAVEWSI